MHPNSTRPPRVWGMIYGGTGELEAARALVEKALSDVGLSCRTTRTGTRSVVVEGEQRAPWYQILRHALPQRVRWRIESSGDALQLSSDFRLFRWYAAFLALLQAVIASCFVFDYLNAERRWLTGPAGGLLGAGLAALAVVLMQIVIHFLGALGGRSSERLWQSIIHGIQQQKGHLAPQRHVSLRYSLHLTGFFGFCLVLTLWFFLYSSAESGLPIPRGGAAVLGTLFGLLALLVVTVALMFGRRGFGLRIYPIVTGLMTMLCTYLLLAAILAPWWATSTVDYRALGPALCSFGWLLLGGGFVLAAAAAYVFFYFAIYSTGLFRPGLKQLGASPGEAYRLAVGGVSPWPFQAVFFLTWLLFAGLSLSGLAFLVACALQGLVPMFDLRELQLVHRSSLVLAAVLGLAPGDRPLSIAVRALWLLAALGGVGVLLASAGQLWRRRSALRRRLAAAAERPFPRRSELEEMLDRMRRAGGLPPIRLAPGSGSFQEAGSERFGLWRVERYIEIPDGSLSLPAPELEALLAHECAHHALGHLGIRSFVLWLGRLSLTGDGFVFALLDSLGYERQADRTAVDVLQAPRDGLLGLLERIEEEASKRPDRFRETVPPMTSLNPSLATRWSLFLEQYCHGREDHYWHPLVQERIEALHELDERPGAG